VRQNNSDGENKNNLMRKFPQPLRKQDNLLNCRLTTQKIQKSNFTKNGRVLRLN